MEIQHGIQDQIFFLGGNEKVCYWSSMGKYSMAFRIRKKQLKVEKEKCVTEMCEDCRWWTRVPGPGD